MILGQTTNLWPYDPRSHKLDDAQLKYSVGDKELLSIIMVLTELQATLLQAMFHIHTDHLNITTNNTNLDCII